MWDLIRANQRRSGVLIVALGMLLGLLGAAIGYTLDPSFAPVGVVGALAIWGVLLLTSLAGGESLLLGQAGAREVDHNQAPQLFNVVEEMQIASGLSATPRVFIIDNPVPNAFAVGLNEKRAAVAVTTGLMARLNRDELQGVIAHEIAHIRNRDTLFMTLAGVTLGAVVMLADMYFRGLRYGSYRGRRSSNDSNQAAAIMAVIAVLLAILAPLLAQLLYFACSRQREYLADACGAQFTRYPEGLASALEKVAGQQAPAAEVSRVLAPMYIAPPSQAMSLMSTHPPMEKRVNILRGMSGDSSLAAYEKAYRAMGGGKKALFRDTLSNVVPARAPTVATSEGWRSAKNTLHNLNDMRILDCTCGLRIKLPPGFANPSLNCPRCGKSIDLAS